MTIVSRHAIITWEQETLLQGYFIHCMPAALRSCCFYTGSSAALAQIVIQGRKYLQFTNEEAGSQTLRKMNFFDDKIKRHVKPLRAAEKSWENQRSKPAKQFSRVGATWASPEVFWDLVWFRVAKSRVNEDSSPHTTHAGNTCLRLGCGGGKAVLAWNV